MSPYGPTKGGPVARHPITGEPMPSYRARKQREKAQKARRATSVAKFPSKCGGCGDDIEQGSRIHLVEGDWVCESCRDRA